MKKRGILIICLVLFLTAIYSINAYETITNTTMNITIRDSLKYDLYVTRNVDTGIWDNRDTSATLGDSLNYVEISDESGEITIKSKAQNNNQTMYIFDTSYATKQGIKPIYIQSTNNDLIKINDYILELRLPMGVLKSETSSEEINVMLSIPDKLSFLTAKKYNKLNTNRLSMKYKDPNSLFLFTFLKSGSEDKFTEIKKEGKIFYVENNEKLVAAVNDMLANTKLIAGYPEREIDFIVVTIADLSSINTEDSDPWARFSADNMIIVSPDLIAKGTHEEIVSILLHELTHYSNYLAYNQQILPGWLEEGIAVSTEVKYRETFEDSGGKIPASIGLYDSKPTMSSIRKWYRIYKDFESMGETNLLSNEEKYALYGFVINYYEKSYGISAIASAIKDMSNRKNIKDDETIKKDNIYSALITMSNKPITQDDIFFPMRDIFLEDTEAFANGISKFVSDPSITTKAEVTEAEEELLAEIEGMEVNAAPEETRISIFTYVVIGLAIVSILLFLLFRNRK